MAESFVSKIQHVILNMIIGYVFFKLQIYNLEIDKCMNISKIAALYKVIKRLITNYFPVGH
jgi:hypothetical protein